MLVSYRKNAGNRPAVLSLTIGDPEAARHLRRAVEQYIEDDTDTAEYVPMDLLCDCEDLVNALAAIEDGLNRGAPPRDEDL